MYSLYRNVDREATVSAEALPFAVSLILAEFFFQFHSFTLEMAAFLGTWFALSYLSCRATKLVSARVRALQETRTSHD